ncbi:6-phosphogluconolactonase [Spirochaetia bacterium]|nr:6-phosphogluconolactonase [Spirochaetia bacterium]
MTQKITGYIGTYTEAAFTGRAEGIYSFTLNRETGVVEDFRLAAQTVNPSYLAVAPNGQYLYAVNEVDEFVGKSGGGVTAFAIAGNGELRLINQVSSEGKSPCHIVLNDTGTWAIVSNYANGTVAVLPVEANGEANGKANGEATGMAAGSLGAAAQIITLHGSGPNRERQERSHAHSFLFDKHYTHGFVCDLGSDRIMAYSFNSSATAPLNPAAAPWYAAKGGAGPRHGVFHPSLDIAYFINELDSTADVLRYGDGSFTVLQTVSTLPEAALSGVSAFNTGAAIKISADGNYVYASNRGHDRITVFRTRSDGTLEYVGSVPSGGKIPRDFALDPSGNFLLATHQESGNLTVFRIDRGTGLVTQIGDYPAPSPVCVIFR